MLPKLSVKVLPVPYRNNELRGSRRGHLNARFGRSEHLAPHFRFPELSRSTWNSPILANDNLRRLTCLHATYRFI